MNTIRKFKKDEVTRNRQALIARRWREKNPERAKEVQDYHQEKRLNAWREFLAFEKSKPYKDCGNCYPACVMDFDHVRGIKKCWVGHFQAASQAAKDEIAKCDLVCANCHRVRTHNRRPSTKIKVSINA